MTRHLAILGLLALLLAGALGPGPAAAAPAPSASGLRFLGCITGKLPPFGRMPFAPHPGGCAPIRPAVLDAEGSGLAYPVSLAASPDGRSLYAASPRDDTVIGLRARPLRWQGCLSANVEPGPPGKQPCKLLPNAGREDVLSGFNSVRFVTVSPDGRNVYTTSGDHSLGIFARDRGSGKLAYKGCITGATDANSTGKRRVCRPLATATTIHEGIYSGLGGPASLAFSPDGRFVYVAARGDAAVSTFARSPNGSLRFQSCLTGGISAFISGFESPCAQVAPDNSHGSGLRGINRIVLSPDGTSLYASSPTTSSVTEFRRDPVSGRLTFAGCITGESRGLGPGNPCRAIPLAQEAGFDSGMWLIERLAISRDGRSLYGAARGDDVVPAFSRDPATGTLTPLGSYGSFEEPTDLALSPGGRSLFVAARGYGAVARYARDPADGDLTFEGCLTGKRSSAPAAGGRCGLVQGRGGVPQLGFGGLSSVAVAGGTLYATATYQSAISRFGFPAG